MSGTNNVKDKFRGIVDKTLKLYDIALSPRTSLNYLPAEIVIEPTNRCNLHCLHCHHADMEHPSRYKGGFMDMAVYRKVVDEICHWAEHITLNVHGEPLLHRECVEMVRYAKGKGMAVSLVTNATLLRPEISDALIASKINRVVFSFEGSHAALHEAIRSGSNYAKTLGNILYFLIANQKSGRSPTFVCMSMVDSKYAHDDVDAYQEYFRKLPINTTYINAVLNFSHTTPLGREIPVKRKMTGDSVADQPVCRILWEELTVCWDGTVSACPTDHTETHIVGDVKTESLEDIWNGERMQKFRQCHLDHDFSWIEEQGALCVNCNARLDDPELDLLNIRGFVVEWIVRQAQKYGAQLAVCEGGQDQTPMADKVAFAEDELRRIKAIC